MNFLKNYLLSLITFFILNATQTSLAQNLSPTDTTFALIYAKYSTLTPDNVFDSPYNKWKRMEAFWNKRLPPGGSFKYYNAAYKQLYNSLNSNSSSFMASTSVLPFGSWQSNGPTSISNFPLNVGRLDKVQVDPDDLSGNTIYACSNTGGIFKTTDGGVNWINFYTDIQSANTPFGTTRVSEIRLAKDVASGKKYLFAAVGGDYSYYATKSYAESSVPFNGIYRMELGTGVWVNISNNLNCPGYLEQNFGSYIYKILVDPTDINNIYLATSRGVFYTCNAGCTLSNNCNLGSIVWKQSNITTPVLGLDFDYSIAGYKSLYCSFKQIWHTNDIINLNFNLISSTNPTSTELFNDMTTLPVAMTTGTVNHVNICTVPTNANKLFISVVVNNYSFYFLDYDKTSSNLFPTNFSVKYQTSTALLGSDHNFIHYSKSNPNLIVFNLDCIDFTPGPQSTKMNFFDLTQPNATASSFAYALHGDNHDFDFTANNKLIGANDGGVYKINLTPTPSYAGTLNGKGLAISRIFGGSVWEKTGNDVVAGFQDGHTQGTSDLFGTITPANFGIWNVLNYTGDGSSTEYMANGDFYCTATINNLLLRYNKLGNSFSSNLFPSCISSGPSPEKKAMKSVDGEDLYYGESELGYTNFPKFSAGTCASSAQWYNISNFQSLSASTTPLCGQNWISSFDVSADHKTIYAGYFDNTSVWNSTCQASYGSFVPIYKTTQGGINNPNSSTPCTTGCWTGLGNNNTLLLAGLVTAVAMHPANPNQVWVGSGGNNNGINNRHIIYSNNGGTTFTDFSAGLPNFAVNDIVVRKGTDYEIYAATDIGVYYRTSTMTTWQRVSNNLPFVIVSDLQIDNCNNKLHAYTYGRGMWSIDLPPTNNPGPMPSVTLSQNLTTYTGTKYIMNDIIIPTGKQLTITGANIYMGANTSIIVQPGARLDIVNSTVQSYCDKNMWQQILVNGVGTAPQAINSGTGFYPNHGVVYITNSTIKDAGAAAVTLYNGGVVNAQNSNFINNRKGLEFYIYSFPNNQCQAKNCIFDYNANLKDPNNNIDAHVTAWAVDGVKFYGCTFKNTAPAGSNFNNLGNGIYSIDAFYTVDNDCGGCGTPPSTTGRSLFSNLNYGVYSQAYSSSLQTLNLRNADFNNCYGGAYIKAIDFAKVQWCNYTNIPNNVNSSGINPYGLYFDNCQNYFCENNNFTGITSGATNNFGLIINSANFNATRAYYCDFSNLLVGSTAYFDNYNNAQAEGLRFNCNKYTTNLNDVAIIGGYINGSNTDIDHVQGSWNSYFPTTFTNTVRNLYSANCIYGDNQWTEDDIVFGRVHVNHVTESGNGGSYFTRPQAGCYVSSKLTISSISGPPFTRTISTCPISGSGAGCALCNPPNFSKNITANSQNLLVATSTYTAALDGGNTQTLLNAIYGNTSTASLLDMLKNKLYLSDTVQKAYYGKTTIPPDNVQAVFTKNAPVSQQVWQVLLNRKFSTAIMDDLNKKQFVNNLSNRDSQQGLISSINAQLDYLYSEKLRLFMGNSTYRNNDSLKANILASTFSDKAIKLIDFYINTKQYSLATSQLSSLLSSNPTYSQFVQFKTDVITGLSNSKGILSLKENTTIKNRVTQLASTNFAVGQKQAQALANFVWGTKYVEFTALPKRNNGMRAIEPANNTTTDATISTNNLSTLKIIPNPSSESTSIFYKLPTNALTGKILITDIAGKTIQYYDVIASLNQIYFNTSNLNGGIYFVNLICNNNLVKSEKLVVLK